MVSLLCHPFSTRGYAPAVYPIQAECGKAMLQTWLSVGKILELPEPHNL